MSEVKKIATRDSFGNTLVELGKEHDNLIVLDPRRSLKRSVSDSAKSWLTSIRIRTLSRMPFLMPLPEAVKTALWLAM